MDAADAGAEDEGGSAEPPGEVTLLLQRAREGDERAGEALLSLVHGELRRLAQSAFSSAPPGHTLQPTALVHEAWMRLARSEGGWQDREHFYAVAARAMRSVLVDHARRRGALRRQAPGARVELDGVVASFEERAGDLAALDAALEELAARDQELARIVELRFFGGMQHPAIARVLGVPLRRVERGWSTARAWLLTRLGGPRGGGAAPGGRAAPEPA